jgi:hypothetical protein
MALNTNYFWAYVFDGVTTLIAQVNVSKQQAVVINSSRLSFENKKHTAHPVFDFLESVKNKILYWNGIWGINPEWLLSYISSSQTKTKQSFFDSNGTHNELPVTLQEIEAQYPA